MDLLLDLSGPANPVSIWQVTLLTILTFAVGLLGGFIGLALGVIRFPFILLGVTPTTAADTDVAVRATSALVGAIRHLIDGRVDMKSTVLIGLPILVRIMRLDPRYVLGTYGICSYPWSIYWCTLNRKS